MMRKKGGPLRHLEGWEVGIVAIAIAALGHCRRGEIIDHVKRKYGKPAPKGKG